MIAITFDTLKFVETLKESGFNEPQAKGMAVAIQEVQKSNLDELATKGDVREIKSDIKELEQSTKRDIKELAQSTKRDFKELEQSTKRDFKELEQSTKRDLAEQELRLIKWVVGSALASVGIIVTALFTIIRIMG